MFSFSATAGASQSTTKSRLAGNNIYTVKFDGCESVDYKDGSVKVLKFKFSNEDGIFEHTIFEPMKSKGDFERDTKGLYPNPSVLETTMLGLKHLIDALNPAVAKEINEGTKNLGAKDWDGIRKLVVAIFEKVVGTTTDIKLVTNNKGEAVFPSYFTGLTKPDPKTGESKAYIKNNFVGSKLAFTPSELTRIKNQTTAAPTTVDSFDMSPASTEVVGDLPFNNDLDMTFDLPDDL